ncbi:hypothetical protein J5J83_14900 [Azoarcus sp. L1K30]|uniref:hypothetical protein n=1 Tax=Azoarcus sp. L1K30 TaxID=2820277 RepID=UPI001B8421B6|nr:hypothetical protein [Azoarcus sp. L1K30]MBR0567409.1 hypothetical protein [Azoarcus sp. L1K30]
MRRIQLSEASAKIRNAGGKDDDEDMQWPAGAVPIETRCGTPLSDPDSVVRKSPYQQLS